MILGGGQRRGRTRTFGRLARVLMVAPVWTLCTLAAPALTAGRFGVAMAAEPHGKRAEAKTEFEKAQLHYRLGRFEEALKSYTRAYELFNAPALLFNIGQCHKNLGNHERAIFFFEGYLREETNPEKRALAQELITASRAQLERQRVEAAKIEPTPLVPATPAPAVTEPAPAPVSPPAPIPVIVESPPTPPVLVDQGSPSEAEPEHPPVYRTWWFWTAVGVGAAVITGAAIYYATGPTKTVEPSGSVGTLDRR